MTIDDGNCLDEKSPLSLECKICAGPTDHVFDLPAMKNTGGDMIPHDDDGNLAHFYQCRDCNFLFSDIKDNAKDFYEFNFTGKAYSPEPGSEIQYMRLLHLAVPLVGKPLWKCEILDFGCGVGHFVKTARHYLGLSVFGYDLAHQETTEPYIFSSPPDQRFDIIVAREVAEHFTEPRETFQLMKRLLKPNGVIAFQTALYRPGEHDRTWGYIGPKNGHVTLYSEKSLRVLQRQLSVSRISTWQDHLTVVAWQIKSFPRAHIGFRPGVGAHLRERLRSLIFQSLKSLGV